MDKLGHKFLFFLERDFHIALLKPLMIYIYDNRLGEQKVYAPFNSSIGLLLRNVLPFPIEVVENPWAYNPDITFMADFSYQYVQGLGKLVNIGHGTICKGWFYSHNKISQRENCADLICVPGTIHKERLEKQVYKPILVTGMPKLDKCFDGSLSREAILQKYGLDPQKKTILLAPTFNEEYSILPHLYGKDLSKIFPAEYNLIVKLHGVTDPSVKRMFQGMQNKTSSGDFQSPHSSGDFQSPYSRGDFQSPLLARRVFISESYDTDEVFVAADLLISDVSSVIYEFLSLGKPILLFDSPRQREYINFDETDLEWQYRDVGVRFSSVDSLQLIVDNALKMPNGVSNVHTQRLIGQQFVSIRDGKSAERVVKASLSLIDNGQLTIDSKMQIDHKLSTVNCQLSTALSTINYQLSTKNEYILFKSPDYHYSPQFDRFMLNQMVNGDKVGIVVPLVDDNELHQQHFRSRVKLAQDFTFEQAAIQLGYAFCGHSIDVDFVLPHSFMVRRELLQTLTSSGDFQSPFSTNEKLFIYLLLANVVRSGYRIVLAYDCVIKPIHNAQCTMHNDTSSGDVPIATPTQTQNGDVGIATTDYDRLVSLDDEGKTQEALAIINEIDFKHFTDIDLMMKFMVLKAKLLMKSSQLPVASDQTSGHWTQDTGHSDDVLYYLNMVLQYDERNAEALVMRGVYFLTQNKAQEALTDFDVALGNYDLAITNYEEADKRLIVRALLGKGMVLNQNPSIQSVSTINYHLSTAKACFAKVLDIDPENIDALKNLLQISWQTRDFADIKRAFDNYLEYHPANLEILFSLAGVCFEIGEYSQAREHLEKILIFDGEYPGAREMLGRIMNYEL